MTGLNSTGKHDMDGGRQEKAEIVNLLYIYIVSLPPGNLSLRHLSSSGSWILSALASGDQVLGQRIHSVPAGLKAESLCFVKYSTPVIDNVVRKPPLHWPDRVLSL